MPSEYSRGIGTDVPGGGGTAVPISQACWSATSALACVDPQILSTVGPLACIPKNITVSDVHTEFTQDILHASCNAKIGAWSLKCVTLDGEPQVSLRFKGLVCGVRLTRDQLSAIGRIVITYYVRE